MRLPVRLLAARLGGPPTTPRSREDRLLVPVRLPARLPLPARLLLLVPPLLEPESVAQSSSLSPLQLWLFSMECTSSPWPCEPPVPRPSRIDGELLMLNESGVWSCVYFHEDERSTPLLCCPCCW